MHTCPSSRKQHRNTDADKREKVLIVDSKRVSRIIVQAALTLLPKGFAETVIASRTHLNKAFQEYSDSKGKLRVSRQVLLKEMKMQHIAIYKPKKDQRNVCLGHMALSPNRTSGSMKREKKSQD